MPSIFADNSRFLFDDDIRFNGFNERYVANFKPNGAHVSSLELRAGQYIFSNPNVAVIAPNSPLARAGDIVGTTGRSATLFHQGLLANQTFNKRWNSQIGADIQIYRHPNHIQLALDEGRTRLTREPGIRYRPFRTAGRNRKRNHTPGGAMYTAPGFQVVQAYIPA